MTKKDLNFQECYQVCYQQLSFTDFTCQYRANMPKARLFELSLPWLEATQQFMLEPTDNLIVHCLFNAKNELLIAWPLVHQEKGIRIKSLSSFYSAITEPIYFTQSSVEEKAEYLRQLFGYIEQSFNDAGNNWQSMQLGSFDQHSVTSKVIVGYFPAHKVFSQTDNIYQRALSGFEKYYQQRPSQLRNTIKRRGKKLAKAHQYETRIISQLTDFQLAFQHYKTIYQQSWKGEEYSFDFIEQVCLAALSENKLRLGLLYIDGEAAAAQIWFVQDCLSVTNQVEKNASIFKLAYNPGYQEFSVGSILSMALSEHVINHDEATSIEFGMGSEPYKKDWLESKRQRVSYQIFNYQCFYGKLAVIRYIFLPKILSRMTRLFFKK